MKHSDNLNRLRRLFRVAPGQYQRQSRQRAALGRRKLAYESLEPRHLLAAGALIGVDFDSGSTAPTNWNLFGGFGPPALATDLRDETGDTTIVDLATTQTGFQVGTNGTTASAGTIPNYTHSLTGISGLTFARGSSPSTTFQWQSLTPGQTYELYVFGLTDATTAARNRVTITGGGSSIAFDQVLTTGNLWVNGQVGNSSSALTSFVVETTANGSGQITIQIVPVPGSTGVGVAGLALREKVTPPATPTGLTATATGPTSIFVDWNDAIGATNYKLERRTGTSGSFTQIYFSSASSYTDSGAHLTPGTTYQYRVRANNSSGDSEYSSIVTVTTDTGPPTGLTATATGQQSIFVYWNATANASGYKLERRTGTTGMFTEIYVGAVTEYADAGEHLNPNTTYEYRVRATYAVGDSAYSANFPVTTLPVGVSKIAHNTGGGPTLANGDIFGSSVAALGDLDGDDVIDLAVGAPLDDTGGAGYNRGAVYVLFMNADGTVKSRQKIAHNTGGGPSLAFLDQFGSSVAALGDLDGNGVTDIAVGAPDDDAGGNSCGAVYVLFLNADGTVGARQKITTGTGGGPTLPSFSSFGASVASLGDLDGDSITDLAVGARGDGTGGAYRGAAYVLFLNADGTVKSSQKIASSAGGGPILANGDQFGSSVASLGDVDGNGVIDLAVGATGGAIGNNGRGAIYVLFLNTDGTVKSSQRIADAAGGGPTLMDNDRFGTSIAPLWDLDGDSVIDLVVGASGDDTGGTDRGAIYVLLMNPDGTAKGSQKTASAVAGAPTLADSDRFGSSVTTLGDLDGDGVGDLAIGAYGDDTGGTGRGAVYVLFRQPVQGDYSRNGMVDAADYVVWRKTLGTNVPNGTGADGNGNGIIDAYDFGVWRANYGNTMASLGSGTLATEATSNVEQSSNSTQTTTVAVTSATDTNSLAKGEGIDLVSKASSGTNTTATAEAVTGTRDSIGTVPETIYAGYALADLTADVSFPAPTPSRRAVGSWSRERGTSAKGNHFALHRDYGLMSWLASQSDAHRLTENEAGRHRKDLAGDDGRDGALDAVDMAFRGVDVSDDWHGRLTLIECFST